MSALGLPTASGDPAASLRVGRPLSLVGKLTNRYLVDQRLIAGRVENIVADVYVPDGASLNILYSELHSERCLHSDLRMMTRELWAPGTDPFTKSRLRSKSALTTWRLRTVKRELPM